MSESDKKQTAAIQQLEQQTGKEISRVEERALGAENKAGEAGRAAQQADSKATQATELAQNARQLAEQNQSGLGEVRSMMGNINNFKLVSTERILFGFDRATLTDESRQKLDQMIQAAPDKMSYVFEVEGFTDRSGPTDYNLALSRRRADAVVRYLVGKEVPLRRIHMIGLGEAETETQAGMAADASDQKLTRKEMRSVVVRVFAPAVTAAAANR